MVELAHEYGAKVVAHGCTAKGNDQVRIDVSIRCLDPSITVLGPAREWGMTAAADPGLPGRAGHRAAADQEEPLLHRREPLGPRHRVRRAGGPLGSPRRTTPTPSPSIPQDAPDEAVEVVVGFEAGLPVALDGEKMGPVELVETMDMIGGAHGFGRIDMVENRLVGIKSREIYEAAGSLALIMAHRETGGPDLHPGAAALQDWASTSA